MDLLKIRKKLKLTQKELARLIGVTTTSYNLKENGKRSFTDIEMLLIKEEFKKTYPYITVDDIFF